MGASAACAQEGPEINSNRKAKPSSQLFDNQSQSSSGQILTEAVPGTTTVLSDAGSFEVGITLPGTITTASMTAPGSIPADLFNGVGEPVLSTSLSDAVVSSYSTGRGTQTLITINSTHADQEYRFPLSIPIDTAATIEADGSVAIRTTEGELVSGYRTPWAYDANGRPIATKFSVEGDTLVQTIDFEDDTAFPVVTGPSDVAAGGGVAGEILGIASIKEACFDS